MAVLHPQGGACRRGAPCWRVSYSERQEEEEEVKENKLSFGVETTSGVVQVLVMLTFTLIAVSVKGSDSLESEAATCPTQSIHQIGSKFL